MMTWSDTVRNAGDERWQSLEGSERLKRPVSGTMRPAVSETEVDAGVWAGKGWAAEFAAVFEPGRLVDAGSTS
jgi:hypothetical protein